MQPGRREALMLGAAGLAAAAAGFLLGPALVETIGGRGAGEGAAQGAALRAASLTDLTGQRRRLSEWSDRILICNFWATWCAPCREEIPLLMATRQKYAAVGVEIVGIAIDNGAKVVEFSRSFNISYPILLAETEGLDLMRKLGNAAGGLPYTVISNRQGSIVHRKLGAFREGDLDTLLGPLTKA